MELPPYIKNSRITLKVIPNAKSTRLVEEKETLKLYLHAPPEKGKANKELIKFFKKEFQLRVELISGAKSREKVLQIN